MRYYVQSFRPGTHDRWPGQMSLDDRAAAIAEGQRRHTDTGLPIRVVDDDERILWKSPEPVNAWIRRTRGHTSSPR